VKFDYLQVFNIKSMISFVFGVFDSLHWQHVPQEKHLFSLNERPFKDNLPVLVHFNLETIQKWSSLCLSSKCTHYKRLAKNGETKM